MRFAITLNVFFQVLRAYLGAIDIALRINSDTLGCAGASVFVDSPSFRIGIGYERDDLAVFQAAHSEAAMPAVMVLGHRLRFGVSAVEVVVLVDEDSARPTPLVQLRNVISVLIKNLNAIVVAIGDIQPALG